jgi:hypothetical protein
MQKMEFVLGVSPRVVSVAKEVAPSSLKLTLFKLGNIKLLNYVCILKRVIP